ncbi:hypothetical protein DL93DRAFT_1412636 [Clavulina sp. PMI_390]|nr:hypothetical protein DL93DRAFT_1412636 [Clavulina sp. PMI_390]
MPQIFHRDILQALNDWYHSRKPVIKAANAQHSQEKPRLAITPHRIFGSVSILAFGIAKAVLGYRGNALGGTTLDWILGVFLALLLYWVGLFEWCRPGVAPWFFHRDLLSGEER